jgi:putative oxidoreductase
MTTRLAREAAAVLDSAYLSLIGRVLLGLIFLVSAVNKIVDPQGTQHYMALMGLTWMTTLLYLSAVAIELAGALSLLLGYRAQQGAWLLWLFMIPTTWIFHTQFSDPNQIIHFLKNLSMMGGLLYVAQFGAGPFSMDAGVERIEYVETPPRPLKKVV